MFCWVLEEAAAADFLLFEHMRGEKSSAKFKMGLLTPQQFPRTSFIPQLCTALGGDCLTLSASVVDSGGEISRGLVPAQSP